MGVTGPTRRNARDGQSKGKGNVDWVAVRSEANFAASETLETTQGRVIARTPSPPNPLWCLANIDVAGALNSKATVFLVPAMDAIAAD